MRKSISIILSIVIVLIGCSSPAYKAGVYSSVNASIESSEVDNEIEVEEMATTEETTTLSEVKVSSSNDLSFSGLDDKELLNYVENTVYSELVNGLNSDEYFVENE